MILSCFKFSGLGNKIIIVDLIKQNLEPNEEIIKKIAQQTKFDQLLTIEPPKSPDTDLSTSIFNVDGSIAESCINGARCLTKFILEKNLLNKNIFLVSTESDVWKLGKEDSENFFVEMGGPDFDRNKELLPKEKDNGLHKLSFSDLPPIEVGFVNIGNPHCVNFTDHINAELLEGWGKELQSSNYFPNGVNLGLAKIKSRNSLNLRVYERGAGETEACGSGACASVVLGNKYGLLDNNVEVFFKSGSLKISYSEKENVIKAVGKAKYIEEINIDL